MQFKRGDWVVFTLMEWENYGKHNFSSNIPRKIEFFDPRDGFVSFYAEFCGYDGAYGCYGRRLMLVKKYLTKLGKVLYQHV